MWHFRQISGINWPQNSGLDCSRCSRPRTSCRTRGTGWQRLHQRQQVSLIYGWFSNLMFQWSKNGENVSVTSRKWWQIALWVPAFASSVLMRIQPQEIWPLYILVTANFFKNSLDKNEPNWLSHCFSLKKHWTTERFFSSTSLICALISAWMCFASHAHRWLG